MQNWHGVPASVGEATGQSDALDFREPRRLKAKLRTMRFPENVTAFAEMLKNPAMKKMMQQSRKVVLEKMYKPLSKELNLTPEEDEHFMAIMQQRAEQGMENTAAILGDDLQAREEALKQMTADHETQEQQIKDRLGEERYAKFIDYSLTAGDRLSLNQFTSANSVSDAQTTLLLEATKEERRQVMADAGKPLTGSPQVYDLQVLVSEEELNKQLQRQESVNSRVLERAKTILAPEQVEAFEKFQANQIETARMSMNMARTMFGGAKAEGGSPPSTKP